MRVGEFCALKEIFFSFLDFSCAKQVCARSLFVSLITRECIPHFFFKNKHKKDNTRTKKKQKNKKKKKKHKHHHHQQQER